MLYISDRNETWFTDQPILILNPGLNLNSGFHKKCLVFTSSDMLKWNVGLDHDKYTVVLTKLS